MNKIRFLTLAFYLCAFIAILVICNGCTNLEKYNDESKFNSKIDNILENLSKSKTENNDQIENGSIYLDTSISMQGYISTKENKIPFTLLQYVLHNVIHSSFHYVGISKPYLYCFGGSITPSKVPLSYYTIPVGGISPRSRFICSETDIVGVFKEIANSEKNISVVITDGSQDVHESNGVLAAGYDRPEFTQTIRNGLIKKGFGIWLIGIMNDFEGPYYNIIPDRNGDINKPHYILGKRPVYCWVLTKNVKIGREFVQYLYSDILRLSKINVELNNGENIKVIEISPGIYPEISINEPIINKYFRFDNTKRQRLTFVLDWKKLDKKPFYIVKSDFPLNQGKDVIFILQSKLKLNTNYDWNCLPIEMWQIEVKSDSSLVAITKEIPDIKEQDLKYTRFAFINIFCDGLIGKNSENRVFEFPIFIYADIEKELEYNWLMKWSTPIDTEFIYINGKTLYLYEVIRDLLQITIGKKRIGAALKLKLLERK